MLLLLFPGITESRDGDVTTRVAAGDGGLDPCEYDTKPVGFVLILPGRSGAITLELILHYTPFSLG